MPPHFATWKGNSPKCGRRTVHTATHIGCYSNWNATNAKMLKCCNAEFQLFPETMSPNANAEGGYGAPARHPISVPQSHCETAWIHLWVQDAQGTTKNQAVSRKYTVGLDSIKPHYGYSTSDELTAVFRKYPLLLYDELRCSTDSPRSCQVCLCHTDHVTVRRDTCIFEIHLLDYKLIQRTKMVCWSVVILTNVLN